MIPREITTDIIVHGSWTPPTMDIGVEEIRRWHLARGFSDIGYHFVIRRDGTIEEGRLKNLQGAHVEGFNESSIGTCLVGGKPDEHDDVDGTWTFNYTYRQLVSLGGLIGRLMFDYPDISYVMGHRAYPGVSKDCPGFDVEAMFGKEARLIR